MYATNRGSGVLGGKMGRRTAEKNLVILPKVWAKIGVIDPMIDIWMGPFLLKMVFGSTFKFVGCISPPPDRSDAEKRVKFLL